MHFNMEKVKVILRFARQIVYFLQGFIFRIKLRYSKKLKCYGFESGMKFLPDYNRAKVIQGTCLNDLENCFIHDAEMIYEHRFNIFGSNEAAPEEKIKWSRDFKSGFLWPSRYYKCIRVANPSNHADVKVPWELSRFNHLITLGKAYWLTEDEKYSREFQNQILDWIQSNPVGFSVNWACTMEVAIRAVNWISGYFYFKSSTSIDRGFWEIFYNSLFQHGCFITSNLENRSKYTNNHFIADLTGLTWLGLFFKDTPYGASKAARQADAWLKTGINGLNGEISIQVYKDGTHYEASTYYHKFVTEMFLITEIVCKRNGVFISGDFSLRLEKMCEFIKDLIKPDGMSPLIGDADDGRLLIFSAYSTRNVQDFRHILAAAGEHFDREDFRKISSDYMEDATWAAGTSREDCAGSKEFILDNGSKAYCNGGYYLLKNKRIFCLMRCGPLACAGTGGHSHNDQLSFILSIDGQDFFVDPGTYVYTADYLMRNLFRSTSVHNTLFLEGQEQNDFMKNDLFYMKEQTFSQCMEFTPVSFRGRHFGYREKPGLIHERRLMLRENGLSLEDLLEGYPKSGMKGYLNFTLDPKVKININNSVIELINGICSVSLYPGTDSHIHLEDGFLSTAYGTIEKTKRIILENIQINKPFHIEICVNHETQECKG